MNLANAGLANETAANQVVTFNSYYIYTRITFWWQKKAPLSGAFDEHKLDA